MEPQPVDEKNMPATQEAMAELFDDISPAYFVAEGFDATAFELNKMSDAAELNLDYLERECFRLKRQAQAVSKKVSALIMQNSMGFGTQVRHYSSIQTDAHDVFAHIVELRRALAGSRRECRVALAVVANHRKIRYLKSVRARLRAIARILHAQNRLKQLIASGDYFTAVELGVRTVEETQLYSKYNSIRDVSRTLIRALESIEFYVDDAMAAQTVHFDVERYRTLITVYEMIGSTEKATQKLQRFVRATIESTARAALADARRARDNSDARQLDCMSYEELCQTIPAENVVPTAKALLTALQKALSVYHALLRHHIHEDERRLCGTSGVTDKRLLSAATNSSLKSDNNTDSDAQFTVVEKGAFQKSLVDNLQAVFRCAALKFDALLSTSELNALSFDHFILVVEMTNRFRKFGRRHFGNVSAELAAVLARQSELYFRRYHVERMDELRFFLESEAFALCPVSVQFTLFDLPEFHFLKESATDVLDDDASPSGAPTRLSAQICVQSNGEPLEFMLISEEFSSDNVTPNDANSNEANKDPSENGIRLVRETGAKRNSHEDPADSDLQQSSSEESVYDDANDALNEALMPNVCNTALNLLRFFGRYIRMTSILRSISETAIFSIIQLYKYFFYTIYAFFCADFRQVAQTELDVSTSRLRNAIAAVHLELIPLQALTAGAQLADRNGQREDSHAAAGTMPADEENSPHKTNLVGEARRSAGLNLDADDARRIFALTERIVGVESVTFLTKQFELLRPVLESLTKKKVKALDDFYKTTLPAAGDLRRCAFGAAASRVFDYADLIRRVVDVKWDVQEIHTQHSTYVDYIITECTVFNDRLVGETLAVAHVSQELKTQIWSSLFECLFRALVQGIAEASRKCSNEGRALMLLDFGSLINGLEALTGLRPLPRKAYLENYIKAFYLPQDDLGEWIIHHTEYTVGEVTALLNACSAMKPGRPAYHKLRAEFGEVFFDNPRDGGQLKRRELGQFVFRHKLNRCRILSFYFPFRYV